MKDGIDEMDGNQIGFIEKSGEMAVSLPTIVEEGDDEEARVIEYEDRCRGL